MYRYFKALYIYSVYSRSHFFSERGKKKEVKHHLQSTSYLQVQERGAHYRYLEIANTAKCYNKQACMIMFQIVQCLSSMASL